MPPPTPSDLSQDQSFLAAPRDRQVQYLSAQDPSFAAAPPDRQQAYLDHLKPTQAAVPPTFAAPPGTPGVRNPSAVPTEIPQTLTDSLYTGANKTADDLGIPTPGQTIKNAAKAAAPTLSDAGQALMEGPANTVGSSISGVSKLINMIPGVGSKYGPPSIPPEGIASLDARTAQQSAAQNPTQQAVKTGEQVGEMLLPVKELEAPSMMGRILASGAEMGAKNASQGGSPITGAIGGVLGGGLSEGFQKLAPQLAESALGVTSKLRGHGRDIGNAILDETKGIFPSKVGAGIESAVADVGGKLEAAATAAGKVPGNMASTLPALQILYDEAAKATDKNSAPLLNGIHAVWNQLTEGITSGQQLGTGAGHTNVSPSRILALKRGIGDIIGSWAPAERAGFAGIEKQVYGALDAELDRTVPEAKALNDRLHNLLPANLRAKVTENSASSAARIMDRMARPTGALLGAAAGGGTGYKEGGVPGAIAGGAAGLVAPVLLTSPAARMAMARVLDSQVPQKLLVGAGLQADRKK